MSGPIVFTPPTSPRCGESLGPTTNGLCISFFILSLSSVALRLYTRHKILRIIGPDDIAIIVAEFLALGLTVTTVLQVIIGGMGKHSECVTMEEGLIGLKALLSNTLVYNAAQLSLKISFLLQYRRLFPSVQKLCTYGLIFLGIFGFAQVFYTTFGCVPLAILRPQFQKHCINSTLVLNINGIVNVVTDFAIFAIPIWPVIQLQMPLRRKLQLLGVFCLGFFACIVSIIRLQQVNVAASSTDPVWIGAIIAYWSTVELNIGILCACLPTLRPLLKKVAPGLLGTTENSNSYSHKLSTVPTRKTKPDSESGIYIQKDVEFQSTTELRSKEAPKNPFSVRGESLDEISNPDAQVTSKAQAG